MNNYGILCMGGGYAGLIKAPPIALCIKTRMEVMYMPLMLMLALNSDADREAFASFYQQYEHMLFKAARKYLSEQVDCEDAVQETCRYMIDHYDSLHTLGLLQLAKYGVSTVENKAKDMLKSARRHDHEDILHYADELAAPDSESLADPEIVDALDRIPARYRDALLQVYYCGFTIRDVAKSQNITQAAAKKLLQRSRDALRSQLTSERSDNA